MPDPMRLGGESDANFLQAALAKDKILDSNW
jgi:hypothetical protein